jgi:hypothetical protein
MINLDPFEKLKYLFLSEKPPTPVNSSMAGIWKNEGGKEV